MMTAASEPSSPQAPPGQTRRVLENFEDFLDALRALGFVVTLDHYLHVQTVLDRLGPEATDERLETLLCPLFATSAERQAQFYQVFEAHQQAPRPLLPEDDEGEGEGGNDLEILRGDPDGPPGGQTLWQKISLTFARARRRARRSRGVAALTLWRRGLVGTLIILVAATGLLFAWSRGHSPGRTATPGARAGSAPVPWDPHPQPTQPQPTQPQPTQPSPTPPTIHAPPADSAPGPTKTFILQVERGLVGAKRTLIGRYHWWPWAAGGALLALPFLVGSLARRFSKDGQPDRRTSPYRDTLSPRPPPNFYQTPELSRAARALRRREDDEVQSLDLPASIRATVNALGYPTLRLRHLSRIPEYLVLIDRASHGDQQAHLFDALTGALRAEGLYVQRYFFDGSPDFLIRADTGERARLTDLRGPASDHVLILCGDGQFLIDRFTGKLHEWTAVCEGWSRRAVLTPTPTAQWGARERVLARRFRVLPAMVSDLGQIFVNPDRRRPVDAWGPGPAWRDDRDGEVEAQVKWLQTILAWPDPAPDLAQPAAPVFVWLCACAMAPILHWDLTLRLGMRLADLGLGPMQEEDLLRLARLPYFRVGAFPPDLRLALIRRLTPAQAQVMRAEVLAALGEELPPPGSYAADVRRLELAAQAWLLRQDAATRRALKNVLRTLPRSQVLSHPGLLPQLEQGGFWGPGQRPPLSLSGPAPWWRTPVLAAALALLGIAAAWLPFLPGRRGPPRVGALGPLAFGNVPAGQTAHIAVALSNPANLAVDLQNPKIEQVPLATGGTGTFVAAHAPGSTPSEPTLPSVPFLVHLGENTAYLGVDYTASGTGTVQHATFPITIHGTHPAQTDTGNGNGTGGSNTGGKGTPNTNGNGTGGKGTPNTNGNGTGGSNTDPIPLKPKPLPVKPNQVIPDKVQALIAKLKSGNPSEKANAAGALGRIGAPAAPAVPALIAALKDTDNEVRFNAADALGRIGVPAAVPALIAALKDTDKDVRSNAAVALGAFGASAAPAVHGLIAALKDTDNEVRLSAANTLGWIGAPAAVPALIAALSDPYSVVSDNARDALQKIRPSGRQMAADLNRKNAQGETPLIAAVRANNLTLVSWLLEQGADPNIADDSAGQTPLHLAAGANREGAATLLLKAKGVDVNAKDNQGETPLDLATEPAMQALLRQAGGISGTPVKVPAVKAPTRTDTPPPATAPSANPAQQALPRTPDQSSPATAPILKK